MGEHHITRAANLAYGPAYYPRARRTPGLPVQPVNFHDFGVIVTADADGVCAAQAIAGAVNALINGALAAAGVATFDVARNVVAVSANAGDTTQTLTITGTDDYGETIVATLALNGTTPVVGLKAFKTITRVAASAALAGNLTVGSGVLIGLRHRVDRGGLIIAKTDNATDAATFAPAIATDPATAATGDVRGTVSFAAAPNSARAFTVFYKIGNARTKVGAYGVAQFAG